MRNKTIKNLRYAKGKPPAPKENTEPTKKKGYFDSSLDQLKKDLIQQTGHVTMYDVIKNNMGVEDLVKMKEKSYPTEDHWNPKSKNYNASILDEASIRLETDKYNDLIRGFKRDLKIQQEVIDYMQNMNRPYKKQLRGNQTNVYDEVKDYRTYKTPNNYVDKMDFETQTMENHKIIINNSPFVPN